MIPYDNKYRKSHRVLGGDYGYCFTDEEKEVIRERLHTVAKKCLQRYGLRKTAVDRMAAMTDISKRNDIHSFDPAGRTAYRIFAYGKSVKYLDGFKNKYRSDLS